MIWYAEVIVYYPRCCGTIYLLFENISTNTFVHLICRSIISGNVNKNDTIGPAPNWNFNPFFCRTICVEASKYASQTLLCKTCFWDLQIDNTHGQIWRWVTILDIMHNVFVARWEKELFILLNFCNLAFRSLRWIFYLYTLYGTSTSTPFK